MIRRGQCSRGYNVPIARTSQDRSERLGLSVLCGALVLLLFTGSTMSAFAVSPYSSALLDYWSFNQSGTTATDQVGTQNATLVNGASIGTGVSGTGLSLTMTGGFQYADAGTDAAMNFGSGGFTINAWINPTSYSSSGSLIVAHLSGAYGNGWCFLLYGTGQLVLSDYGTWGSQAGQQGGVVALNKWTMVTVTGSGGSYSLYENGVLSDSFSESAIQASSSDLTIGGVSGLFGFNGGIDEVGIWNQALGTSQVSTLYNGGSGLFLPEPSLGMLIVMLVPALVAAAHRSKRNVGAR